MTNQYQELAIDCDAIMLRMKQAGDVGEYRRLQTLYLRGALKLGVEEIATATGLSQSHVRSLHSAFRRDGIATIISQPKGGRHNQHLSLAEEKEFILPFIEKAKSGGILEIGIIHQALKKRLGREVNRQVAYNILHRHGWRKLVPRPRHPKTDIEAQEAFKKTGLRSLRKRGKKQKS